MADINGFQYAWEDIQIVLSGNSAPIEGVVEIEYTSKKEHTNIYGKGDDPHSMGRGKSEYSGKLVILQDELEAMQANFPGNKPLTKVAPFTITVSYAPDGGGPTVTDQIPFVRIQEVKKGMKTGDGNQTIELPFICGAIKYNV